MKEKIFNLRTQAEFKQLALDIFRHQAGKNPVYKRYIELLSVNPQAVNTIEKIPFLPIQFFKTEKIINDNQKPEIIFTSSGTTGNTQSKHYVADLSFYRESYAKTFKQFYNQVENYVILALLPSYLERKGSSLIFMVENWIHRSKHIESNFYLNNLEDLYNVLHQLKNQNKKVLLIGVSFALLDFVERFSIDFPSLIVMETGGMKGRRNETVRAELHQHLKKGFGVKTIHSEYGMTELLTQAYSQGNGIFQCPPWMKILIRNTEDPFSYMKENKTGGINIIDLANYHSISFIATDDLGRKRAENQYEILGRFDYSDIRGCNLLI